MRPEQQPSIDMATVAREVDMTVTGMPLYVRLFSNNEYLTEDAREYLLNECNVILECKVCLGLFRKLPNYLYHKRLFCSQKANQQKVSEAAAGLSVNMQAAFVQQVGSQHGEDPSNGVKSGNVNGKECEVKLHAVNGNGNAVFQTADKLFHLKTPMEMIVVQPEDVCDSIPKLSGKRTTMSGVTTSRTSSSTGGFTANRRKAANPRKKLLSASRKVASRSILNTPSQPRFKANEKQKPVQHSCPVCAESFPSFRTMTEHVKNEHVGHVIEFPCVLCDLKFEYPQSVIRHLGSTHKRDHVELQRFNETVKRRMIVRKVDEQSKSMPNNKSGKQNGPLPIKYCTVNLKRELPKVPHADNSLGLHHCKNCRKLFGQVKLLKSHENICEKENAEKERHEQTTAKPSPLPRKSMKLNKSIEVQKLMNVKNMSCKKCGTCFDATLSLRRHIQRHLLVKRWQCKLCQKMAFCRSKLIYHVRHVHAKSFSTLPIDDCIVELKPPDLSKVSAIRRSTKVNRKSVTDVAKTKKKLSDPKKAVVSAGAAASVRDMLPKVCLRMVTLPTATKSELSQSDKNKEFKREDVRNDHSAAGTSNVKD